MTAAGATRAAASPYQGLFPYAEEDAERFFGRESEIEVVAANLRAHRLTVLYGDSGVGKSSLLRAGAVHHLRETAHADLRRRGRARFVPVFVAAWRDDPVAAIAAALNEQASPLLPPGAVPPGDASTQLDELLEAWSDRLGAKLLLVLDQLEEYLLYHGAAEGGPLVEELPRVVARPEVRANVLLAIREDALAQLDRFKERLPTLMDNRLQVRHLDRQAARRAIEEPLAWHNRAHGDDVAIEPALVEAVLDQVEAGRVRLDGGTAGDEAAHDGADGGERRIETPYLQLVLTRLWEEETAAGSRVLRLETLERLGGAERIVRGHLDAALGRLGGEEQDVAAEVFRYLVTPSGTKIAHSLQDLAELAGRPEAELAPVVEELSGGRRRILRPVAARGDGGGEALRYEIFHDVLGPAIVEWRRTRERERLALEKRRAEEEAERERRRALRFRALAVAAGGLFAVAAIAAAAALVASRRADREAERAERQTGIAESVGLASRARAALDSRLDLGLLLAVEAVRAAPAGAPAAEARSALLTGARRAGAVERILQEGSGVYAVAEAPGGRLAAATLDGRVVFWNTRSLRQELALSARGGEVVDVALGRGGLVAAATEQGARVWRLGAEGAARAPERLVAGKRMWSVAFDPEGSLLATGGDDGLRLWRLGERGRAKLEAHELRGRSVYDVAFAPAAAGPLLATGDSARQALLWDVANPRSPERRRELGDHGSSVLDVAFSPDGRLVASGGFDGAVAVERVRGGAVLPTGTAIGHDRAVQGIAFSPDGSTLATASNDTTVALWELPSGDQVGGPLEAHVNWVESVAFTADGSRLMSGSLDGTVLVWDVDRLRRLGGTVRVGAGVAELAAAPRGDVVAYGTGSGDVVFWSAGQRRVLAGRRAHEQEVSEIAWSSDGALLASGAGDHVRLWNAGTRTPVGEPLPTAASFDIAFAPGRRRLAVAIGPAVTLYDVSAPARPEPLGTPYRHSRDVYTIAFAGGRRPFLALGDVEGGVAVLDVSRPERPRRVFASRTHANWVADVAFSPDGRTLATASFNNVVLLWAVAPGGTLRQLADLIPAHRDSVVRLAFAPDGRTLAAASHDRTATIWDVAAPRRPIRLGEPLTSHREPVRAVAFADGGRTLVVGSGGDAGGRLSTWDGLLWSPATPALERRICRAAGRNLTRAEWDRFLTGKPYRRTCPQWPAGR